MMPVESAMVDCARGPTNGARSPSAPHLLLERGRGTRLELRSRGASLFPLPLLLSQLWRVAAGGACAVAMDER
jgi:hypothetical protein